MAINPKIRDKAEKIRKEVYGKDVREALASGLEMMSEDVEDIKDRQVNVESQFQAVLDETTGKDIISAPEVIAARVGADGTNHANLKERLDQEHQEVTAQLAKRPTKEEVDEKHQEVTAQLAKRPTKEEVSEWLGKISDGTPEFADNINDMTDTTKLYVNLSDGFLYSHDGTSWVSTGVQYQSTGIQKGSIGLLALSDPLKVALYTEFDSALQNLETSGPEITIGYTAINRDPIPQSGILSSITVSVAIPGTINIKVFSRNDDNTFNLESEFPLEVVKGIQTFYAGKDYAEIIVEKGWYVGYYSSDARLFGKSGARPSNYYYLGDAKGTSIEMGNYGITTSLIYKVSKLNSEIQAEEDEKMRDKASLLNDIVESSQQTVFRDEKGNVRHVIYTGFDGEIKRWDSFRYYDNKIIENRVSAKKQIIELEYDLSQYITTVKEVPTPTNLLKFDPIDWKEWSLAPNASVVKGKLVITGSNIGSYTLVEFTPKSNTKYGVLIRTLDNTISHIGGLRMNEELTGFATTVVPPNHIGVSKLVFTTKENVTTNYFSLGVSSEASSGKVVIDNVAVFEIPLGSQFEYDFENLNAEELVKKYL